MIALKVSAVAFEALALGVATGPICLAACGPVVVPWMLILPDGWRVRSRQLGLFLAARLAGYLVFAGAAWSIGSAVPQEWRVRAWVSGCVQLLLALALLTYAVGWRRTRSHSAEAEGRLVQISLAPRPRIRGAATLGFLSGINLCPPFLVAGVRAAELGSMPTALFFFLMFFAGTAVWFLPFLALGLVHGNGEIATVARMAAVLLACYYGFLGVTALIAKIFYA